MHLSVTISLFIRSHFANMVVSTTFWYIFFFFSRYSFSFFSIKAKRSFTKSSSLLAFPRLVQVKLDLPKAFSCLSLSFFRCLTRKVISSSLLFIFSLAECNLCFSLEAFFFFFSNSCSSVQKFLLMMCILLATYKGRMKFRMNKVNANPKLEERMRVI